MLLAARPLFRSFQPVRNACVAGPPSVRMTLVEKAIHGLFITFTIMSVPCYITYKIPRWNPKLNK